MMQLKYTFIVGTPAEFDSKEFHRLVMAAIEGKYRPHALYLHRFKGLHPAGDSEFSHLYIHKN